MKLFILINVLIMSIGSYYIIDHINIGGVIIVNLVYILACAVLIYTKDLLVL